MSNVRKEYLCQITVLEARDLQSSDSSGSCDPFILIRCGNLPAQSTTCEDSTNSPCWNQSFTFTGLSLTEYELETWELKLQCYDFNAFLNNELVGEFAIGLSTIHRNSNHEFFNVWVSLMNPEYGSEPRGYVQINCFIVGPDDVPPSHAIGDNADLKEDAEEEDDDYLDELLTPEQKKAKKEAQNRLDVVGAPLFARKSYQLSINIYKAEDLPESGGIFSGIKAFISARFSGMVERTQVLEGNSNPVFNAKISFPAYQPILNDKIIIRVWNKLRGRPDILIGTIPEVPRSSDFFNVSTLLSRGGVMTCRWINLYGMPQSEDTLWRDIKILAGVTKKSYIGSAYMGRLLISLTVSPNENPETGVSKAAPYREPVFKSFSLKCVIFELKNAKGLGDRVELVLRLGPHYVTSKIANKKVVKNGDESSEVFTWGSAYLGYQFPEIKEPFPVDATQCPDIIIDLYSVGFLGKDRIGYVRKPIVEINDKPVWLHFRSLEKQSEVGSFSPGQLLAVFNFEQHTSNPKQISRTRPRKAKMRILCQVYGGYNLIPGLESKATKTYFKVFIGDKIFVLDQNLEQVGKYPRWCWVKDDIINVHEDLTYETNLRFVLYNRMKVIGVYNREVEIGSFTVPLHKLEYKWDLPHFFHIIDPDDENISQGRILAEFRIFKNADPILQQEKRSYNTMKCDVKLAVIGLRNMNPPYKNLVMNLEIPGYEMEQNGQKVPAEITLQKQDHEDENNPNIMEIANFTGLELAREEPIFLPPVNIHIKDDSFFGTFKTECFTYIPLMNYADWIEDDAIKRKALNLYNRNYGIKEAIEQIPVTIEEPKQEIKLEDQSFMDYSFASEKSESENEEIYEPPIDWSQIYEPKNQKICKRIQIDKDKIHEDIELANLNEAGEKIKEFLEELKEKRKKIEATGKTAPDALIWEIKELQQDLGIAEAGPMTLDRFKGIQSEYDEDDAFTYSRPVLKNQKVEDTLELPYQRYLLFKVTKNSRLLSAHKVGEPTGGVLKVIVKILPHESLEEDVDYDIAIPPEGNVPFPIDFFHPAFRTGNEALHLFTIGTFQVRVYLLRGQSLSAVDNARDLTALASGNDAMSVANSYPEIFIGNADKDMGKYQNDKKLPENDTLDPNFFRVYVFNASFPSDWQLVINILSSAWGFDKLIGSTSIDLEDRYYGVRQVVEKLYLDTFKEYLSMELETEQNSQRKKYLMYLKNWIKERSGYLYQKEYKSPVEFKPLLHPKKSTAQGMIELYIDVLDSNASKLIPLERIAKPLPEKYEMRLIIWRCENIPKLERDYISIMFKAQFDYSGWLEEAETKETDVHNGSENGNGEFNWRMKFDFTLPCPFARLRIIAYNFSTFGTDDLLSEEIMDLRKYFRQLNKEGKVTVQEEWLRLKVPGNKKIQGGKVMLSIYLLTKAEADQRPVGEGQEDPNRDPELEKPQEGRGIGDFLKGTALDPNALFGWLNFGLIKKLLALLSVVFTLVVLFVYPGLLVN